MSITRLAIFLGVVLSLVAGLHTYFWARLVRDTALPVPWRAWVSGLLLALAIALPLPLILGRVVPPQWGRLFAWPAYLWMGFMFLLFVFLLAADLVRLGAWAGTKTGVFGGNRVIDLDLTTDPSRRNLLARLLGGLAGVGAAATGLFAVRQGLRDVAVTEVDVRLKRLPASHHGITIVQLTDVHVGPTIGRAFVERIVDQVNALTPDIVAITGDLVDGSVEALWDAVSPLGRIRAKHGIFFVTGNHEYFSGVGPWVEALGRLGIRVLGNERISIGGDGKDTGFDLAGVHDISGGRMDPLHPSDPEAALRGRDPDREVVLLAHQPKSVTEAARLGVGLQLSGHTHGGQLWPFGFFVQLAQPFVTGLHRVGETQIYVSPGTGYWGPPMRLGTRAEIARIRLLRDEASAPA